MLAQPPAHVPELLLINHDQEILCRHVINHVVMKLSDFIIFKYKGPSNKYTGCLTSQSIIKHVPQII